MRVDRYAVDRAAIELVCNAAKLRLGGVPVVECRLQRRPLVGRMRAQLAIAADDEESAISRTIAEGRQFHVADGTLSEGTAPAKVPRACVTPVWPSVFAASGLPICGVSG